MSRTGNSIGCGAWGLSLVWFALAGCETPEKYAAGSREITVAPGPDLVRYEQPRATLLRVAPFIDERPDKEREPVAPPLVRSSLFTDESEIGRTTDAMWSGASVSEQLTKLIARDMQATGFFEEVSHEKKFPRASDQGYILTGRIESFLGRRRSTEGGLFRTAEAKEEEGTSDGVCRIRYAVVDGSNGNVLRQDVVEATARGKEGDPADVALSAFDKAQTRMANEVTKFLLER